MFNALVMKAFIWNRYPPGHVNEYLIMIQFKKVGAKVLGIFPATVFKAWHHHNDKYAIRK
jgi:hypothetical protein